MSHYVIVIVLLTIRSRTDASVRATQAEAPREKAKSTSDPKPSKKNHQQRLEAIVRETTVELRVRHTCIHVYTALTWLYRGGWKVCGLNPVPLTVCRGRAATVGGVREGPAQWTRGSG